MNIYVLSTIAVGFDTARLLSSRVSLNGVIGLGRREPDDSISGYIYGANWCTEYGLPFVEMKTYNLSAAQDQERLRALDIDLLLVLGWQRLVPEWLLTQVKVGCIGIHGSSHGISGGRGRSPQNWALILRQREFSLSIFRIDAGVDSGAVLDTCTFPLTNRDDIMSSYAKVCWMSAEMLASCITQERVHAEDARPQEKEGLYLPQRIPEDGQIDWNQPVLELDAFIRALSRPYPGAYSPFENGRLIVWRARPFVVPETAEDVATAGTIAHVLSNGSFIIRVADGWLLVDEYTTLGTVPALARGQIISSADRCEQMQRIVQRHQDKYPSCPLHPDIVGASQRVLTI